MQAGVDLARTFQSQVTFIHVTEPPVVPAGFAMSHIVETNNDHTDACATPDGLAAYVTHIITPR